MDLSLLAAELQLYTGVRAVRSVSVRGVAPTVAGLAVKYNRTAVDGAMRL